METVPKPAHLHTVTGARLTSLCPFPLSLCLSWLFPLPHVSTPLFSSRVPSPPFLRLAYASSLPLSLLALRLLGPVDFSLSPVLIPTPTSHSVCAGRQRGQPEPPSLNP